MMQAIILAGGAGTRLRELYDDRPKVLVPINGRPFLLWQLEWLGRNNITDIHIAAGYKAEVLLAWLKTHHAAPTTLTEDPVAPGFNSSPNSMLSSFSLRLGSNCFTISVSVEPSPLGTGGGLKFIEPWIRTDPFLVVNGDSLVPNLDLQELQSVHGTSQGEATLAVTWIEEAQRYGTVRFDEQQRITSFAEKAAADSGWVNGGVYVMNRTLLALIAPAHPVSIETQVFPILTDKHLLGASPCPPPLLDMGTPQGIQAMESFLTNETR